MDTLGEFLAGIDSQEHRSRLEEILVWVAAKYPGFGTRIASSDMTDPSAA